MKRLLLLATFLLSALPSFSFERPLPESGAWKPFSDAVNEDKRYFAKNF